MPRVTDLTFKEIRFVVGESKVLVPLKKSKRLKESGRVFYVDPILGMNKWGGGVDCPFRTMTNVIRFVEEGDYVIVKVWEPIPNVLG